MSAQHILALNSGSSTLKFGAYRVDSSGAVKLCGDTLPMADLPGAMATVERALAAAGMPAPDAIGHRIVHGGPRLREHCRIDDAVLRELRAAAAFAPLHGPAALTVVALAQAQFRGVPQLACLDTHFHTGLPDVARVLPIARALRAPGIHRYGFHGLSLESVVRQLGLPLPPRLVIAHLGSGASITAVQAGRSIDTSMGLTPGGGVIMGTRSGDLDPGLLVHLMRDKQRSLEMLDKLLTGHSGLLGVSGLSSDLRQLHQAAATNPDAALAIAMFCQSVRKQIAAMASVLGGADMLVFTGGIGENDARVRSTICHGLACFGLRLDEVRNRAAQHVISDDASHCQVQVLASQEDEQIARHAWTLLT